VLSWYFRERPAGWGTSHYWYLLHGEGELLYMRKGRVRDRRFSVTISFLGGTSLEGSHILGGGGDSGGSIIVSLNSQALVF
jgi:hypothetical protein